MGNRREYLIKSIVEVSNELYKKGWVANHDGNITIRFEDNFLATPTSVSKADIVPEMILTLDKNGEKIHGIGKSFSEMKLHLAAYQTRNEIQAVVHAHPPFCMARGLVGGDFEVKVPEAIISIGDIIPVVEYTMPGTKENTDIVSDAISGSDVFMIAGNGVLAVGRDLKEAFLRMELLEHLIKIDYYAKSMGTAMKIPEADRQLLLEKRASLGLITNNNVQITTDTQNNKNEILKDLISQEIKKALQEK